MKAALQRARGSGGKDVDRALRFYDRLARVSDIDSRTTCLEDYTHQDWARMRIHAPEIMGDGEAAYEQRLLSGASLNARMDLFAETALDIARGAFAEADGQPDLLVQVSCTGYDSPTAVQRVAAERGWSTSRILHLGHMGCYAALPAVQMAAEHLYARTLHPEIAEGRAGGRAAILLVELCTLHHNPATTDVEQIVQQCLFADGAARVDVSTSPRPRSFALLDHAETIIPNTLDEMTWRVADSSFRMTLSRRIPQHITDGIGTAVSAFLARSRRAKEEISWWAIHPGGPRVIESTAEALGLPADAVRHSKSVFRERGNMSSTTIPHIWSAMSDDDAVRRDDLVCSVAFGPGLTVALNLMRRT